MEQVIKAPPLVTTGGFSMSHIGNYSPDSASKHDPYSYYLSGNINFKIKGVVDLPVSFAYTNNQATANLSQPFNRLALSPSYKWIQTHLGYASMQFSPYTLSGHEFFGAGVELSPEEIPWKFAAMYGRFKKAVRPDSAVLEPSYLRTGGGFKVAYTGKNATVGFNLFKAKDDAGSVHFNDGDSTYISPQDNLAGSMDVQLKFPYGIAVAAEYGISALNRHMANLDSTHLSLADRLFYREGDVAVHHAFKTSVSQSSSWGRIGATYERVAPNYLTLGAYYFTNDFENITADFSSTLIKWLHFSVSAGTQRDNLEQQKVNTSRRAIFSANTTSPITKKLTLGLAFSNVQSFVHIRDAYDQITQTNEYQNLDTLNFTQLNLSASSNINYVLASSKTQRQNLNLMLSYQEASEQQNDDERFIGSRIYNGAAAYQIAFIPSKLNISTTVSHNLNDTPEQRLTVTSYNLSLQKTLWDHFKTSMTGTYSQSANRGGTLSNITNMRLSGAYTLLKKHNFNLSLSMLDSRGVQKHSTLYSANLAYSYIFNFTVDRQGNGLGVKGNF
ncbi:MAG: hypothetical protein QM786_06750 [Breznakibacter sp.]